MRVLLLAATIFGFAHGVQGAAYRYDYSGGPLYFAGGYGGPEEWFTPDDSIEGYEISFIVDPSSFTSERTHIVAELYGDAKIGGSVVSPEVFRILNFGGQTGGVSNEGGNFRITVDLEGNVLFGGSDLVGVSNLYEFNLFGTDTVGYNDQWSYYFNSRGPGTLVRFEVIPTPASIAGMFIGISALAGLRRRTR